MKDLYKNIHSHIFTMQNAPQFFLNLYLPKPVAKALDTATNTQFGASVVGKIIGLTGSQGKKQASFLKIGKSKSQLAVFEELMDQYSDKSMEMIALTLNMEFIGAGKSTTGFEGQIQQVIDIKKQYPDRLMLFLGIDPRWKGTGTELRKTVESYFETRIEAGGKKVYPFTGLKIYPSTGFYAFDEKLKETFRWAADNGVPVMTHTYYLGGIFNYSKQAIAGQLNAFDPYLNKAYAQPKFIEEKNWKKWIVGANEASNCKKSCSYFLEPESYVGLLKSFHDRNEKLKICFAHFGGVPQIKAAHTGKGDSEQLHPYGVTKKNWHEQIRQLMTDYPFVYTDISYAVAEGVADKDLYDIFLSEAQKPYGDRILFGTDYFMTEMETREANTYDKFKSYASTKSLQTHGNATLWDQLAKHNPNDFLQSKYY